MDEKKIKQLISEAYQAQKNAYTPYSHWQVGAALLTKNGTVYQGCNIENAAFSPTNCAERTAFFKAVSEGEREFQAIAIVGNAEGQKAGEGDYCAPCGVCRQVMMEFCNPQKFQIILAKNLEEYQIVTLEELLPMGFSLDSCLPDKGEICK
ncbi:MAG: cytidine deaminase [Hespellia sp.]|nr:cytidine deaminase [Hespellia sp.]